MKKVSVISDTLLAFGYIFLGLFSIVCPIFVCTVEGDKYIRLFFIGVCTLFFIVLLTVSRRAFFVIALTDENILLQFPFRKRLCFSYSDYPHVEHGSYLHFGFPVHYLVFSKLRFSTSELMRVNNIPNCSDTIKIRCTKRNCRKLLSILPASHYAKTEGIMKKYCK